MTRDALTSHWLDQIRRTLEAAGIPVESMEIESIDHDDGGPAPPVVRRPRPPRTTPLLDVDAADA